MLCYMGPLVGVGIASIAMGLEAVRSRRIALTKTRTLTGKAAVILGWFSLSLGAGLVLLGIGGLPVLFAGKKA